MSQSNASLSRMSRGIATSKSSETLNSCFGVETPSMSARGSFSQARRALDTRPGAPTPGPAAYDLAQSERASGRNTGAYKATIGNSPRRTSPDRLQVTELDLPVPGPQSYDTGSAEAGMQNSPHAVFGRAPRSISTWSGGQVPESARCEPGPTSYSCDASKVRVLSPSATIGKSARNTLEYIAKQDPAAAAPSPGRGGANQSGLASPRVRGGVIGTSRRAPRSADGVAPGPCTYEVDRANFERTAHQPSATIGNSPRNTCEYLVRDTSRGLISLSAGGARTKSMSVPGGVIGSASRPGAHERFREASPGPMTYTPNPTALSTFK